jgi:hypothetical protein
MRCSPDPATAEAAEKLIDNAVRLRLYAIQVIPRLCFRMIFPSVRVNVVVDAVTLREKLSPS